MTEYIIIVALVAIAAIGVFSFFGQTVRAQMASITDQLGGKSGKNDLTSAQNAAKSANKQRHLYNLSDYNKGSIAAKQ